VVVVLVVVGITSFTIIPTSTYTLIVAEDGTVVIIPIITPTPLLAITLRRSYNHYVVTLHSSQNSNSSSN